MDDLLPLGKVADMLGVSKQAVSRWIQRKIIKSKKVKVGRQTRQFIPRSEVDRILGK